VLLGFDDVLRDRIEDDEECCVDDRTPFCAAVDNGSRRAIAASATPIRFDINDSYPGCALSSVQQARAS